MVKFLITQCLLENYNTPWPCQHAVMWFMSVNSSKHLSAVSLFEWIQVGDTAKDTIYLIISVNISHNAQ